MKTTIENLRQVAELNLCESCSQKYKMLIEPSIRHLLLNPIEDWGIVEFYVNQMVMKKEGVFEGTNIDKVIKAYNKIEKRPFPQKIDCLVKERILQKSCKELLYKANKVRNKIHNSFPQPFSEQDLELFSIAHAIISNIWSSFEMEENISNILKSNAEKVAEQYLSKQNCE